MKIFHLILTQNLVKTMKKHAKGLHLFLIKKMLPIMRKLSRMPVMMMLLTMMIVRLLMMISLMVINVLIK